MSEKNFGRGDLMAIAAFRYCLGRRSYIVEDCADWLVEQWPNIGESAQKVIQRDLEQEFRTDDANRAEGRLSLALGDDCDRAQWERVMKLWR